MCGSRSCAHNGSLSDTSKWFVNVILGREGLRECIMHGSPDSLVKMWIHRQEKREFMHACVAVRHLLFHNDRSFFI